MFDLRTYRHNIYITLSTEEDFVNKCEYASPGITSAIDGGKDLGILVTEYNHDKEETRIFSLRSSKETLRGVEGCATFLKPN